VPDFTPTHKRMLAVLADGQPHTRQELHACLVDDLGPLSNVSYHLTTLKPKLQEIGQGIACVNGHGLYCLVRLITHRE